ncbi:MAG TPA: cytochrome C oxidase subunit II [Spirochaetota bacterium]|nr:cytochrome C oxidase subunit II [Spirochaetota bacterium]HPC42441.1 cytochrome C oxidase subunit II [Spirochaetota bacterium]HPL17400.1 cytochrome C oxidase subunit II [Spirochaetota bacterium]HQF06572.1 cytochrome C oxidase subunit II [Spirochaetota bacterium]HQH96025.1 cytochrome C oxidase subunit II [Spirochaetota bacterium]
MVDSSLVLFGQTLAYTLYALAIMAVMGWFGYRVTKQGKGRDIKPALFYTFVGFLVLAGVSLHIITHETIPWKPMDLNRSAIKADKTFSINIANQKFILPAEKMVIKKGETVRFNVTSDDLTYGFGLFRTDNSMVFQMQVLPGYVNDILWRFDKAGAYTIRSTEYSGPKGIGMIEKNAVEVVE